MGRTIKEIQDQIIAEKNNTPALSGLTSTSQSSVWRGWTYLQAFGMFFHEQLWDKKKDEIESIVNSAAVGTEAWIQRKVFEFQYDGTPQVIGLDSSFAPKYTTVNPALRIVTRASVRTFPNRTVAVKVAKSDPPAALSAPELSSLQGYLDTISFAGVAYNVTSTAADRVLINATVYYNGQYSSSISADTVTAIGNYLANIPFDGQIRLSSLVDAIQNVEGVRDVVLNDVKVRTAAQTLSQAEPMVNARTTILNKYQLFAGYVISEDTSGQTLSDTLTFTAES